MSRRTVILGATSAVATATARLLAARGERLYLVGRDATRLAALVGELGPAVVGARAFDFVKDDQHALALDEAAQALGGLDQVLIAHGWLPDQTRTEADLGAARATFEANLLSVVAFLVPAANRLEAQGHGQLAVITSVAGQRGRPRNYTYGAAKAALSTYLQGLRSRLYPRGVTVVDLRLGPTDSPMTVGHPRNALFATTEQAAAGIVAALDRGQLVAWVPWYWGPIMTVVRWLPEPVFQRVPALVDR